MKQFKNDPTFLQNNSFQKRDPTNLSKIVNSKPTGQLKKTPQNPLSIIGS